MGGERLNYREYLRCVAGFSRELETLGLNGCRVALLMGNSIDVCIALFAVHAARAEAVPLNPVYTARELLPMLEDAEVAAIIYDEPFDAMARSLAAELNIRHLIAIGAGRRLTEWRARRDLNTLDNLPEAEDPATLQFTGGRPHYFHRPVEGFAETDFSNPVHAWYQSSFAPGGKRPE